MIVWRLTRQEHAHLSGAGGYQADGRWHSVCQPVVYASDTPALALLETFVHFLDREAIPDDYVLIRIDIPDSVRFKRVAASSLESGWQRTSGEPACRAIGNAWHAARRLLVMEVPSAVIPVYKNYVLNPSLPSSNGLKVLEVTRFRMEPAFAN